MGDERRRGSGAAQRLGRAGVIGADEIRATFGEGDLRLAFDAGIRAT
jgi:hypothetical protein